MNHPFYNKNKKAQNKFLFQLGLASLLIIIIAVLLSWYTGLYLIIIVIFPILLSIIAPFFDMPSLKKTSRITYYSPLFIAEQEKKGLIKIHGGTLFDYYFVIDKTLNGIQRTNFIIKQYLKGMLQFIEAHKDNPQLKICGTSYIINKRTAEKMGFEVIETDGLQQLIMLLNYANITLSNSIAKHKLAFPKLKNTKTFEAELSQLLVKKDYIEKLYRSL